MDSMHAIARGAIDETGLAAMMTIAMTEES